MEGLIKDRFWQWPVGNSKDYTLTLISIVKQEKFQEMFNNQSKKFRVWELVADEMSRVGAPIPNATREVAGLKCHQKWRNLQRMFISHVIGMEKGRRRSTGTARYFEEIKDLMFVRYKGM